MASLGHPKIHQLLLFEWNAACISGQRAEVQPQGVMSGMLLISCKEVLTNSKQIVYRYL